MVHFMAKSLILKYKGDKIKIKGDKIKIKGDISFAAPKVEQGKQLFQTSY
jgi:hypothetical protein